MTAKRRIFISLLFLFVIFIFSGAVEAQTKANRISIATGGTGGVYYPLGGGMANVISKYVPNTEATAEVTSASVDNCKLVHAGKADLALIMADTGYDAYKGLERFKPTGPQAIRTVAVVYPNYMHFVTVDGLGIKSISDLKGKRVSTGSPGSGTEVMALRVLESYGINPDKDIKKERLGVAESAGALKDRKVDAFGWVGGLPTAAVMDLAATPGVKIRVLNNSEHLDRMIQKYGPIYFKRDIPETLTPAWMRISRWPAWPTCSSAGEDGGRPGVQHSQGPFRTPARAGSRPQRSRQSHPGYGNGWLFPSLPSRGDPILSGERNQGP